VARILLIDDDSDLTAFLRDELEESGHTVDCLDRAEHGPDLLTATPFDVVLLDNRMPGMTGIQFLQALQSRGIEVPVILMTGYSDAETTIQAMNLGAFDYVTKPATYQELAGELDPLIREAVGTRRAADVEVVPGSRPRSADGLTLVVGRNRAMVDVCKQIGLVARRGDPVLILGETGTGKELVARAIHTNSPRKGKPFVALNCAAIPAGLLESELFGHERGAFTGAEKLRKGKIEHANGGTLFLDEIGDMPRDLQAKLLRVIEYQEVERVGGEEPIRVNVRLLSATRRDLEAAIREERFRDDLFFRLNGVTIRLPPLRERLEDLPALVDYFLAQEADRSGPAVADATLDRLRAYHWPGNVRQLQRVISGAVAACRGPVLLPSHLQFPAEEDGPTGPDTGSEEAAVAGLHRAIEWVWGSHPADLWPRLHDLLERELLRAASARLGGNQSKMAESLHMDRATVAKRMKKYGLK
jgi:two-component system response regulator AtoC